MCSSDLTYSPAWWVNQTAWESAGGRTAGTTGTGNTSLGEIKLGQGRVRILGSLLPDPNGNAAHPFGVSDYAVTYVGYQLFENLLDASAQLSPPISEPGPLTTNPELDQLIPSVSTPEAPMAPLLLLLAAPMALLVLRRRRVLG